MSTSLDAYDGDDQGDDLLSHDCTEDDPCGSVWCDWCWLGDWNESIPRTSTGNGAPGSTEKPLEASVSLPTVQGALWSPFARECQHTQDPVTLSDGTIVHASDHYTRKDETRFVPDVAVYLDTAWHAEGFAFTIGWRDYALPTASITDVLRVARYAYQAAQDGAKVEVACLGSHGRTGTFLAILELLAMEDPDGRAAVANIRARHCSKAVETNEQAWYVECIAAVLTGKPMPKKMGGTKRKHRKVARSIKQTVSKGERGYTLSAETNARIKEAMRNLSDKKEDQ